MGGHVDRGRWRSLVPVLDRLRQRPAILVGEVDQSCGPAERRRFGAAAEGIGGARDAEVSVEMRVRVDPAGKHQKANSVVHLCLAADRKIKPYGADALPLDEDVGCVVVSRGYDTAVFYQERHEASPRCIAPARRAYS